MYSLIALFFCLPLYFSHIFSPFGIIIGETSSFERQKVYLLFLCVILSFLEILFFNSEELGKRIQSSWKYLLGLVLLPFIGSFWWGGALDTHFFIGSHEKNHGYIWYFLLICVGVLLSTLSREKRIKILYASLLSSFIVALFSLFEYVLGGSLFFSENGVFSWGSARSVSTLGNPNYVAGYLLFHIALSSYVRFPERLPYIMVMIGGIIATGSYIGIGLLIFFLMFYILRRFFTEKKVLIFLFLVCLLSGCVVWSFFPSDKLLSFQSRFVLMGDLWTNMVQYPFAFIFGFGPESIISYFSQERSSLVNLYFPTTSAIDSSHNIFLDFIFQYGVMSVILLGYLILKVWKNISNDCKLAILIGGIFLSLNVTVTVHIMMLILLFSLPGKRNEKN